MCVESDDLTQQLWFKGIPWNGVLLICVKRVSYVLTIDNVCPVWVEILTRQSVCVGNNYINERGPAPSVESLANCVDRRGTLERGLRSLQRSLQSMILTAVTQTHLFPESVVLIP